MYCAYNTWSTYATTPSYNIYGNDSQPACRGLLWLRATRRIEAFFSSFIYSIFHKKKYLKFNVIASSLRPETKINRVARYTYQTNVEIMTSGVNRNKGVFFFIYVNILYFFNTHSIIRVSRSVLINKRTERLLCSPHPLFWPPYDTQ